MSNEDLVGIASIAGNISLGLVLIIFAFQAVIQALIFAGVPVPYFAKAIEKREEERFRRYVQGFLNAQTSGASNFMRTVFQNEQSFVRLHQDAMVQLHLHHLGINKDKLADFRQHILELTNRPIGSAADRESTLLEMCKQPPILVDTANIKDPLYREVKQYLNFIDAIYDDALGPYLGDLMANHVRASVPAKSFSNLVLAVPPNGNFLLGFYAARCMRCDLLIMREKPRVDKSQFWDGVLAPGADVVIVHDVAVSGDQLIKTKQLLQPRNVNILGVATLVERTGKQVREKLIAAGLPLFAIAKVGDA